MASKRTSPVRRIRREAERIFNHYGLGLQVERDPETKRVIAIEAEHDRLDEDTMRPEDVKKLNAMKFKYREIGRWFRRFDEEESK